jgi:hypothetical protein
MVGSDKVFFPIVPYREENFRPSRPFFDFEDIGGAGGCNVCFSWISRFRASAVVEAENGGGAELDGAEECD